MAGLNRKACRLLRYALTITIIAMMLTNMAYGLVGTSSALNEFAGEQGKPPPPPTEDKKTDVSVSKVWEPADGHPDSVRVQLYKDGKPYGGPVTLDKGNRWAYKWKSLEKGPTWTVDELDLPKDYEKTVTGSSAHGYVITNTKKDPEEPEEPTTETPEAPEKNEPPSKIPPAPGDIDPDLIGIGDDGTPTTGRDPDAGLPGNIPKTGDGADPRVWLLILAASTIILRKALFSRARNKARQD
ncbi:MAG: Cna B-type domain-containing protein [Clostridiales bacterium]|nr:Cna B-type domain-containing protein [Clostridiales bacterium]